MIALGLGIGIWAKDRGPGGLPPVYLNLDFSKKINSGYLALILEDF